MKTQETKTDLSPDLIYLAGASTMTRDQLNKAYVEANLQIDDLQDKNKILLEGLERIYNSLRNEVHPLAGLLGNIISVYNESIKKATE